VKVKGSCACAPSGSPRKPQLRWQSRVHAWTYLARHGHEREIANNPDTLYREMLLTSHFSSPHPRDFTESNEAHFRGKIDNGNPHFVTEATTNIAKPYQSGNHGFRLWVTRRQFRKRWRRRHFRMANWRIEETCFASATNIGLPSREQTHGR
jgi:hypothetical protein